MLNERQKEILISENLPTDYEELSIKQRVAIEAIEDMFEYLDRQYPDIHFEYAGYIAPSSLESEQLLVISSYGKVTVYRKIDGEEKVYSDDYKEVKASDIYAAIINDHLAECFDEQSYIVCVDVSKCYDEADDATIIDRCLACTTIFVKENVGEEVFADLASVTSEYIGEHAKSVTVTADYFLVKDGEFSLDLPDRYKNNIDMNIFVDRMSYYRRKNGEEKLYDVKR